VVCIHLSQDRVESRTFVNIVMNEEFHPLSEIFFVTLALQPQFGPWPTSMKFSVSLRFSRS
jgi:hypothetical protein